MRMTMKILRMTIGFASIFSFVAVFIQSCTYEPATPDDFSGIYGFIMGCLFFLAGIIGATTRRNKLSGIIAGVIYVIAAIIGFIKMGQIEHLRVWTFASVGAAVFFLVTSLLMKKEYVYGEKPKFK